MSLMRAALHFIFVGLALGVGSVRGSEEDSEGSQKIGLDSNHCSINCKHIFVGDKNCDGECYNAACEWDGGDCEGQCKYCGTSVAAVRLAKVPVVVPVLHGCAITQSRTIMLTRVA